ncbi:MAG: restriction endonuclease [Microvirga sp.]
MRNCQLEASWMTFWGVRAGKHGEDEQFALNNSVAVYGEREFGDLPRDFTRQDLRRAFDQLHGNAGEMTRRIWADQLWNRAREMKEGDLVALPRKGTGTVAFGDVSGPYRYDPEAPPSARHQRPVNWIDKEFGRQRIENDIRLSLGSTLTVFQVRRDGAEQRMRSLLRGEAAKAGATPREITAADSELAAFDLERLARDRIIEYIGQKYRGHRLEELVEAVLRAQGFVTSRTPPGADGGVDILAGRGHLGFETPRLAVQVKSSDSPADVSQVRELQGVMRAFGADLGLFVSWGGYRGTAPRDARRDFSNFGFGIAKRSWMRFLQFTTSCRVTSRPSCP